MTTTHRTVEQDGAKMTIAQEREAEARQYARYQNHTKGGHLVCELLAEIDRLRLEIAFLAPDGDQRRHG